MNTVEFTGTSSMPSPCTCWSMGDESFCTLSHLEPSSSLPLVATVASLRLGGRCFFIPWVT